MAILSQNLIIFSLLALLRCFTRHKHQAMCSEGRKLKVNCAGNKSICTSKSHTFSPAQYYTISQFGLF